MPGQHTGLVAKKGCVQVSLYSSTQYVVSIYRKAATARLDEFIGPKL